MPDQDMAKTELGRYNRRPRTNQSRSDAQIRYDGSGKRPYMLLYLPILMGDGIVHNLECNGLTCSNWVIQ
jgi:hypothetical protein